MIAPQSGDAKQRVLTVQWLALLLTHIPEKL
jgi:hypothetical protein